MTPPILTAKSNWGVPEGAHGEIRMPAAATDTEIQDHIRTMIRKNKAMASIESITYKKVGMDGPLQVIAFEAK